MQIRLRTYELAVELYQECKLLKLSKNLKDQVLRASSSIALNLAEGYGKTGQKDRTRFFTYAFGSLREVQAVADLEPLALAHLKDKLDRLGACLYKLSR